MSDYNEIKEQLLAKYNFNEIKERFFDLNKQIHQFSRNPDDIEAFLDATKKYMNQIMLICPKMVLNEYPIIFVPRRMNLSTGIWGLLDYFETDRVAIITPMCSKTKTLFDHLKSNRSLVFKTERSDPCRLIMYRSQTVLVEDEESNIEKSHERLPTCIFDWRYINSLILIRVLEKAEKEKNHSF